MRSKAVWPRAALITVLFLAGVGLLLFLQTPRNPFFNVEFPVALPAILLVPPPYSPQWLPVVDGLSVDGEAVTALGLALVGVGLGLLLLRRYIRELSLTLSAFVLWSIKFLVEVHPGDHEPVRPYFLVALLLALASVLVLRELSRRFTA